MSKFKNYFNKALIGAGLVGTLYLGGCDSSPPDNRSLATPKDFSTEMDSVTNKTNLVTGGGLQLQPEKMIWKNAKLLSEDEGYVNFTLSQGYESAIAGSYAYSTLLFRGPEGQEISLFGREDNFYAGQNYDIEFYLLRENQDLSSGRIFETLERTGDLQVWFNRHVKDLDGMLSDYNRVKKPTGDRNE